MRINIRFDDALQLELPTVNANVDLTAKGVEGGLWDIARSIERLAVAHERAAGALESIATTLAPKAQPKASRISSKAEIEEEEIPMPPVQLLPTQKFKDTFRFNGPVDGEPVVVAQGPFVAITQDPKVEVATEDTNDPPNWVNTFVTVHGLCTDPTNPGAYTDQGGMISLSVEATVDVAGTEETEKIRQDFIDEFQWIAPGQAKASTISSVPEIES